MPQDYRDKYWKDVFEENRENKENYPALSQEVYMKDKEELINREFLVEVMHKKLGIIIWTCVQDNVIKENEK